MDFTIKTYLSWAVWWSRVAIFSIFLILLSVKILLSISTNKHLWPPQWWLSWCLSWYFQSMMGFCWVWTIWPFGQFRLMTYLWPNYLHLLAATRFRALLRSAWSKLGVTHISSTSYISLNCCISKRGEKNCLCFLGRSPWEPHWRQERRKDRWIQGLLEAFGKNPEITHLIIITKAKFE